MKHANSSPFIIRCFLILLYLLYLTASQQCDQCVDVISNSCKQCSQFCPRQTMRLFEFCTYDKCPADQQQKCQSFGQIAKNVTQQQCISSCCSQNIEEGLSKCFAAEQKGYVSILLVLGIILGMLILTLVGACAFAKILNIKCSCPWFKTRPITTQNQQEITTTQLYQNIHKYTNQSIYQWQTSRPEHYQESSFCPICLQDHTTTVTKCSHWFHFQCIQNWYLRSANCPICKSTELNPIRFYCYHCLNKCVKIEIDRVIRVEQFYARIRGTMCKECRINTEAIH